MTDRKPALKPFRIVVGAAGISTLGTPIPVETNPVILASDLPPAILNATKEELAALAVFAEAMPELLEAAKGPAEVMTGLLERYMREALAAAKEAEP